MSSQQHSLDFLAKQRVALETLRTEVSDRLRKVTPFDKTDGRDAGDMSVADEQSNFDMNVNEMTYDTLRDIDEALIRMTNCRYGICEITGELIPIARLKALPFARCTVEAQRGMERHRAGRSRMIGVTFDDTPEAEEA